MIKAIMILVLAVCFVSTAHASIIARNVNYYPNGVENIVGTIEGKSRNTIEIYDEDDKKVKSLIYLSDRGEYKVGERVSLYYYPENNIVQSIKKETPVQYQVNGQNLGYISK